MDQCILQHLFTHMHIITNGYKRFSELLMFILLEGALGLPKGLRNCSKEVAPSYFRWESHTSESCGEPMNDITLDDVKQVFGFFSQKIH